MASVGRMTAQDVIVPSEAVIPEGTFMIIPPEFTKDGKGRVVLEVDEQQKCLIFDEDLNEVVFNGEVSHFTFITTSAATYKNYIILTQTLFNDDEDYEGIKLLKDEDRNCIGFQLVSSNGAVLQEIIFNNFSGSASSFVRYLISFGTKHYLYFCNGSSRNKNFACKIYLIDKSSSTRIKEVKDAPKSLLQMLSQSEIYDANGKRLPSVQQGLNIVKSDDGSVRKVMMK